MKSRLIIFSIAVLFALSIARAADDFPIVAPDTSGYRTYSTGWSDLRSKDSSVLVRRDNDTVLTVRNALTDSVYFGMLRPSHWFRCYALSSDGRLIAIGTQHGKVEIWGTQTGICTDVLTPNFSSIDWVYFLWENSTLQVCAWQFGGTVSHQCYPVFVLHADSIAIPPPTEFIPFDVAPEPFPDNPKPAQIVGDAVSGKVTLKIFVNKYGYVQKWQVLKADPRGIGYEDEAIRLIQKWRYTPAIREGVPIGVWIVVAINFVPGKP